MDEDLFRLVVEAAPSAMILAGPRGRIALVNRQTELLFGYSREELLGESVELLVPERFHSGHPGLRQGFMSAPTARPMGAGRDLYGRRKDGREIPIEIGLNPITTAEGTFVLAAITDISVRKHAEELRLLNAGMLLQQTKLEQLNRELEVASRFKSEFVATMSHELRTPLNAIVGMAELLGRSRLDPGQREHVQTINESAEALMAMVNSILDFSKIEAGRLDLHESTMSVEFIVEGAADVLAQQARDKGIALHSDVDPRIPAVRGDADRLRQILINLLGNAVKFTERGHVVVRALLEGSAGERVQVRFEVQDTGIGIPEAALPRLFQPFVQVDGSLSRRYGGTGLGLSISKRLVELMGGEIGVVTKEGAGSTFWFTASFALGSELDVVHRTLEGMGAMLVTEDDLFAQIVGRYLTSWGIENHRAQSRTDVLEALQSTGERTWVAIIDMDAPGGEEMIELAEALRGLTPARILTVGSAGALHKPLRQSYLFDSIVRVAQLAPVPAESGSEPAAPLGRVEARGPVLVAEDNTRLQRLLKLQFDELGVPVIFASDGLQAVEALRRGGFAMAFMDCHMPHMDGLEATRTIRGEEQHSGRHVPIVAMTANAFAEDREACIVAGMDDYLAKPVKLANLREMIDRWSREPAP